LVTVYGFSGFFKEASASQELVYRSSMAGLGHYFLEASHVFGGCLGWIDSGRCQKKSPAKQKDACGGFLSFLGQWLD